MVRFMRESRSSALAAILSATAAILSGLWIGGCWLDAQFAGSDVADVEQQTVTSALDTQVFLTPLAVTFYCVAVVMVGCGCASLWPEMPRLTYVLAAGAASLVIGLAIAVAHQPVHGPFTYHLADAEGTLSYAMFGGIAVLAVSVLTLSDEVFRRHRVRALRSR